MRRADAAGAKDALDHAARAPEGEGAGRSLAGPGSDELEKHGKAAIEACRLEKPDAYLRAIATLMPKEVHVGPTDGLTLEQLEAEILRLLGGEPGALALRGQDGETLQ